MSHTITTPANMTRLHQIRIFNLMFLAIFIATVLFVSLHYAQAKDYKKEHPQKGNLCIARFESTTGEPLYYTCPRANESEKKSYCCYLDKCCDYKEFQKQTEQQFKMTQGNYGYIGKGAIGSALKWLLWAVFFVIALIVGCCCLTFFLCRKKKLFQGGIFSSQGLPAQPPGPSIYAPPQNPYMAYQWPPETTNQPAPPAYPTQVASYPAYPSTNSGATQPPYNPNFK